MPLSRAALFFALGIVNLSAQSGSDRAPKPQSNILADLTSGDSSQSLHILVSEFGVNQWSPDLKMFDTFDHLTHRGISDVPHVGQILLPMPADSQIPRTSEAWNRFENGLYEGISAKVRDAIAHGQKTIEISVVQDQTFDQHVVEARSPSKLFPALHERQRNVEQFEIAVGGALARVKQDLARTETVNIVAVGGSNGGRTLARIIPELALAGHNPYDKAIFIDSRGQIAETQKAIDVLHGRVTIVNTQFDAPALPDVVANRTASQWLKKNNPTIQVLDVKPETVPAQYVKLNPLESSYNHVITMKKDSPPFTVSELSGFNGPGITLPKYTTDVPMSRSNFLKTTIGFPVSGTETVPPQSTAPQERVASAKPPALPLTSRPLASGPPDHPDSPGAATKPSPGLRGAVTSQADGHPVGSKTTDGRTPTQVLQSSLTNPAGPGTNAAPSLSSTSTKPVREASAQSNSDPYSVKSSAGTAVVPPQPPPGSEIFNLSRDLYKLYWAKDNIELLKSGLTLHEWNVAIENSTYQKVMDAIERHVQGLGGIAVGVAKGRLAESPIAEIHTEQEKRDVAGGRIAMVKGQEFKDQPLEPLIHSTDPFEETQNLVKRVLQKQGIATGPATTIGPSVSIGSKGASTADAYNEWLAAVNTKIKDVEGRIDKAAKLPEIPGRSAGLSVEIDKIIREGDASSASRPAGGQTSQPNRPTTSALLGHPDSQGANTKSSPGLRGAVTSQGDGHLVESKTTDGMTPTRALQSSLTNPGVPGANVNPPRGSSPTSPGRPSGTRLNPTPDPYPCVGCAGPLAGQPSAYGPSPLAATPSFGPFPQIVPSKQNTEIDQAIQAIDKALGEPTIHLSQIPESPSPQGSSLGSSDASGGGSPQNAKRVAPTGAVNSPPADGLEIGDILARALNDIPIDNATHIPEIPASQCGGMRSCNPSGTQSGQQGKSAGPPAPSTTKTNDLSLVLPITLPKAQSSTTTSFQQQMWDWEARTFPETTGAGSAGISFGDMSTHIGPGGAKATPSISACLDPNTCTQRYFNKSFTVTSGGKVIAGGFGDVHFLGGGYFAANAPGGGAYSVYNAEGKVLPIGQIVRPELASVDGDGKLKTFDSWNNPHYFDLPNAMVHHDTKVGGQTYASVKDLGGGTVAASRGIGQPVDILNAQGNKIGNGSYQQTRVLSGGNFAVSKDSSAMMNATWDILDASGKTIATGYQQVKDLGGMAIGVVKDWFSSNWVVLDLAGHQVGGNYNAVSVQGGHVVVSTIGQIGWTQLDIPTVSPPAPPETLPVAAAPPPSQSAHAITPPVLQKLQVTTAAPATAPETGGISFAGAQNYKEASGVAAQADRASGEAERIPPRKK